jgi:hypothetical protein
MSPSPENPETLPKMLPGAVCAELKKCGKPNCRCARGELHGPYYYRYWRDGRRLRKTYVPRQSVAEVTECCQARRLQRIAVRFGWQDYRIMLDALRKATSL